MTAETTDIKLTMIVYGLEKALTKKKISKKARNYIFMAHDNALKALEDLHNGRDYTLHLTICKDCIAYAKTTLEVA